MALLTPGSGRAPLESAGFCYRPASLLYAVARQSEAALFFAKIECTLDGLIGNFLW